MTRGHQLRHRTVQRHFRSPQRFVIRILVLLSVVFLWAFQQRYFLDTLTTNNDSVVQLDGTRVRIHADWHPTNRRDRFPSVKERVKLYMGNWYLPKCANSTQDAFRYRMDHVASGRLSWPVLNVTFTNNGESRIFNSTVMPDQWFVMDARVMKDCARKPWKHVLTGKRETDRVRNRRNMRPYCSDVLDLLKLMASMDKKAHDAVPILGYFGDGTGYELPLPFFAKFRPAASATELAAVTADESCITSETIRQPLRTTSHFTRFYKPILWKLESSRHFGPLQSTLKQDIPWEHKKDRAFWAGEMTGHVVGDTNVAKCRSNQRCRFVLQHAKSPFIDCWLTKQSSLTSNVVNGTTLIAKPVDIKYIQTYKVIISLEGNDVASGLKWSLLSESVVLMPTPTQTSWAMEELLEPWVHYVPMSRDGSDAEERVKWVLSNDEEARRIAERATLFMYDLVLHPDAVEDDRQVKQEIARRYRALWH